MPILIDGNNLLHSLPSHKKNRDAVRQAVLDQSRKERISVTVIFDGPPPSGSPSVEHLGQVTIIYSGSSSADDVIVEKLPLGASAKNWSVVTNDRGLATRVREKGAAIRTLEQWAGRRGAKKVPARPRPEPRTANIKKWESFFEEKDETASDRPTRIFKPKKGRR